jgi:cell wall-associated NlpC family hydrolase
MRYSLVISMLLTLSCRHAPALVERTADSVTCSMPQDSTKYVAVLDTLLPERIVSYAKTLLGTPYKFGCTAPDVGFDCSGFITYVFNHFGIIVPRSSVDFTNEGTEIALKDAAPGDLILFTGTNSKIRVVGHIGIIVANDTSGIKFIHSSSGSENSVIITSLDERYMIRFVKIVRMI